MTALRMASLAGALVGLGVFTLVRALLPSAPINLTVALERFDHPVRAEEPRQQAGPWGKVVDRLTDIAARRSGWLTGVPTRDLAVLDRPVRQFVVQRLAMAGLGLALPGLLWTFCVAVGIRFTVAIPAAVGIAAAVGLSLVPTAAVHEEASTARAQFRAATSAYLDLVAQERASGRSPTQALLEAAQIGDGWVFRRIHDRIVGAHRLGVTPWRALSDLAERVGVTELADLADIVASAADGAAIYTTLTKKAASLRSAAVAAEQADANARSERLVLPVTLLTFGFIVLVFYPALVAILTA